MVSLCCTNIGISAGSFLMAEGYNHQEVISLTCLLVATGSKLLPQWDLNRGHQLKHLLDPFRVVWASSQYDGPRVAVVFYLEAPCFNSEQGRNCSTLQVPASVVMQQRFLCILLVTSKSLNLIRFKGRDTHSTSRWSAK